MNEILLNILSVVVTTIIVPIISLIGAKIFSFLNTKIHNEKAQNLLITATNIVVNAIRAVM